MRPKSQSRDEFVNRKQFRSMRALPFFPLHLLSVARAATTENHQRVCMVVSQAFVPHTLKRGCVNWTVNYST